MPFSAPTFHGFVFSEFHQLTHLGYQGRRICPGKQLAENSLFITIARVLWAFNISKATDKHGQEITPNIFAYTDGFNSKPQPFQCRIQPRTPGIQQVIEREARLGEQFLDKYKCSWVKNNNNKGMNVGYFFFFLFFFFFWLFWRSRLKGNGARGFFSFFPFCSDFSTAIVFPT